MKLRRRRRVLALAGLIILLLACALIALRQPKKATTLEPVTILSEPFVIPVTARDRFTMTLGPNRRWVSRAERALFGQRNPIVISAEIIQLSAPAVTNLEALLKLGAPTFDQTNAVKVWFLRSEQLNEIAQKSSGMPGVETLSHPRIQTADGLGSSMFMGQAFPVSGKMVDVGFSIRCMGVAHEGSTEMLAEIAQSEFRDGAIQTNMDINVRLNVPNGEGILLVKPPSKGATNGWGIIIHPMQTR